MKDLLDFLAITTLWSLPAQRPPDYPQKAHPKDTSSSKSNLGSKGVSHEDQKLVSVPAFQGPPSTMDQAVQGDS